MVLRQPSGHFTLHKVFSPVTRLGSGCWGHACVKNVSRVGVEVCAKFGEDWSDGSGVKRVHR